MLAKPWPVDVKDGLVYALGATIPVDGRLSWLAPGADRHQPMSAYLLIDGDAALMLDPGCAAHRDQMIGQARALLPTGVRMAVFMTRAESDCIGNFSALARAFRIRVAYTGGLINPFDAFDSVGDEDLSLRDEVALERVGAAGVAINQTRHLDVITPLLRVLATYWTYDRRSKVLFTSDSFGYTTLSDPGRAPVIDTVEQLPAADTVRRNLLAKFAWLEGAEGLELVRADVQRIFAEREVEVIAPSHGCILRGADTVAASMNCLLRVLEDL